MMTLNSHPTLPEFDYIRPTTLMEASQFLVQHAGEARPFLGGTDVLVRMRDGFLKPRYLVDVKYLEGMMDLDFDPEMGLVSGAAVTMNQLIASSEVQEHYPLLAEACRSVASYQLRNRATVVGNICNASPAGDTIGACLVYNAELCIHGIDGTRREALRTFFLGPGKTKLQPGDLVTAIHLPVPRDGARGVYFKLGRNKLSDLAITGVTVLGWPEAGLPSRFRFRLALTSVAPIPLLLTEVENFLAQQAMTPESIQGAARLAADSCSPIDDVRGSARYRKQMVKNLTEKALAEVWEELGKEDGLKESSISSTQDRKIPSPLPRSASTALSRGERGKLVKPTSSPSPLGEGDRATLDSEMKEGQAIQGAFRKIQLTINGGTEEVLVPSNMTLLRLLRESLALTGTKNGCSAGECGACTVLLNGEPVNSCMVLAAECDGASVLTVEGLAQEKQLAPVQEALIQEGGVQCGFCTPGILISSHALLQRNPNPGEAEIREALVGNLCRCTGYVRIIKGVRKAAKMQGENL